MKFGYRDRIVLLVVVIAVILAVGIFVFIRPKWEELNINKETRKNVSDQWQQKLNEFNMIPKRQQIIMDKYEEGKQLASEFTPEMSSIELAKFLQDKFINIEKFQEDEVEVKDAVKLSDKGTSSIGYYFYTPSIITYPLYENADLNGELKKAAEEKLKDSTLLSARAAQTVGSSSSQMSLLINREDAMLLLDAVNDYATKNKDTMMIESVLLKECDFNEEYLEEEGDQPKAKVQQPQEEGEEGEEGEQAAPPANQDEEDKIPADIKPGYTRADITYRVFYMQEPMEPEIGDKYDPTIWDGEEWRTVTAPPVTEAQ